MTEPTPAAAPTPASSGIPFVTDLGRVVRVLFSPTAVFEEQQARPTWFLPWLVIALMAVGVGLTTLPYTDRMMELGMAARGAAGQPVPPSVRTFTRIATMVGAPIAFLILALISAGIMWVTLMLTGAKVRYRGLLSAAVFSLSTGVIAVALSAIVLRLRGAPAEAIRNMQDARVSLGADLLIPADATVSPFLRALLGGLGPIQIWGLIITAIGVMVLEKQDKGSAWMAALASYVVLLIVGGLLAGLGGS